MTQTVSTMLSKLKFGHEYPGANINSRIAGRDTEIDQLAASIKTEGQLLPLLVVKAAKGEIFYVADGNRRLAAMKKLANGSSGETPVEIKILAGDSPEVLLRQSLAANAHVPLHPADRAETFARLHATQPPEEIAEQYGMTVRAVQQSIALGSALAPSIIAAWREGTLSRDDVEVFTLAPDFDAQDEAIKEFRDSWDFKNNRGIDTRDLRRKFMKNKEPEMVRLLGFVGVAEYRAAGGTVVEDFFGASGVVKDMKLLKKLATAKMEGIEAQLLADGWSWVETRMSETFMHHGHGESRVTASYTPAEKKRLAEITARLKVLEDDENGDHYDEEQRLEEEQDVTKSAAEFRAFTDKQKAKCGVIVSVTKTGAVTYQGGLICKEEPKASAKSANATKAKAPEPPKIPDVSSDVEQDLDEIRSAVLADLIAAKPREAFAMFLAAVVAGSGYNDAVSWQDIDNCSDKIVAGRNFVKALADFRKLSIDKMAAKLAILVAGACSIHGYQSGDKPAQALVDVIGEKNLQAGLAKKFDPKTYIAGATKQHMLGILAETAGADARTEHEKDGEAALRLPAITAIKATGWLPPQLRTREYKGPSAKKPAKPASKKKAA